MVRLLLLTIVAGIFLAMFCATPQQPVPTETSGMQPVVPKPLQMEAPPALCGPTASQYQIAQVLLHKSAKVGEATDQRSSRISVSMTSTSRDSVQAPTILRI